MAIPTKKMREVTALEFSEGSLDYICFDYEEVGYLPSDIVLMQSTGLFDKNGVEIFEGDVVLVVSERFGSDTAIVKSDNFGFYLTYLDMAIFPERLNEIELDLKVIGNIYENPELVE